MTYHVPFGSIPRTTTPLDRKLAVLRTAERAYRAYPSAASYTAFREAVYRADPNAANLTQYRRAVIDSSAASRAVAKRGDLAPLRILRPGSYGRLSGLGAVLAIV